MSDLLKSECPHCRQKIEYPADGTGQVVSCPTCGKSIMLMPIRSDDLYKQPTDDPPTEKQLAYLRDLGVQFDEAILTKRSASRLLKAALREKRIKELPSGWRLEKVKRLGLLEELPPNATMQDVVELLDSIKYDGPTEAQIKFCKGSDFKLKGEIYADELDEILKLDGQPPLQEHLDIFQAYGIRHSGADALAARAYADLILYYQERALQKIGYSDREIPRMRIAKACLVAMRDPAYGKPTLIREGYWMTFTWPKRKLNEWYRKGAE
jgi:DNA-directed RNA polymerase subunit RPC12/RpoP